jgi:hypothetical protein
VPSDNKSKKKRFNEYLDERKPTAIGESEWRELVELLAPVSESYLRELLHGTSLPISQPFDGVRQSSLKELQNSLEELERVYAEAVAGGNSGRARDCRRAVIGAKDRARFVAKSGKVSAEKRAQKEEMVEWMLVWLENPEVFPAWARLRLAEIEKTRGAIEAQSS